MKFPATLDPAGFLAGYWQKGPLFLPSGMDPSRPTLSPDELAWLATLPDVESRLIYTHDAGTTCSYSIEHGPFDEQDLMRLPESNWTLLVQDVEKHLPDFRALFEQVPFVPDWRIDDLMVSFAAPGGSVGPHLDQYDVFLCQGEGRRQWRLTTPDKAVASDVSAELSLLRPFDAEWEHLAENGDVLYLPPGIPHWGIAVDRCMTYSIGMRAPQLSEFMATYQRLFPGGRGLPRSALDQATFYRDPDLVVDEARPGLISERALQRMRACWRLPNDSVADELTVTFGCLVTEPKPWLTPEQMSIKASRKLVSSLQLRDKMRLHGMARIAYTTKAAGSASATRVFANGFHREVDASLAGHVVELCRQRQLQAGAYDHWRKAGPLRELLVWLLACGVFDLEVE